MLPSASCLGQHGHTISPMLSPGTPRTGQRSLSTAGLHSGRCPTLVRSSLTNEGVLALVVKDRVGTGNDEVASTKWLAGTEARPAAAQRAGR